MSESRNDFTFYDDHVLPAASRTRESRASRMAAKLILTFPRPSTEKSHRPQLLHNNTTVLCCEEGRF
jgi:hypothetical protein